MDKFRLDNAVVLNTMQSDKNIFAIALASNMDKQYHIFKAMADLKQLGYCVFSSIYQIPCRDGVGSDYWNNACLLYADLTCDELLIFLQQLEVDAGRKRPSHSISLDLDLIAWGRSLSEMQFNAKKLPLATDVIIPLSEIWHHQDLPFIEHTFQKIVM